MTGTTSLTEQNREIVKQLYAAGARGDVEALMSSLADDIVVYEPLFLPYGGTYSGKQVFVELFGKIGKYLDLSKLTLHYLVADGERVIAVLGVPDVNTGEMTHFAEQSVLRDGKVVEMRLFYYDPQSMITAPKI